MKTSFTVFCLILLNTLFAARPSIQAGALKITGINCNSLVLGWNKGNAQACLVIAKEGAAVSYTPSDGNVYNSNPVFGSGIQFGNGNYVVYNGTDTAVKITGLTSGKTYYFTVYGHDNNGSNTEYLLSNAPVISKATHYISLTFSALAIDSCERSNLFRFINTSTSDIPGLKYEFNFGNGKSGLDTVDWHMSGNGLLPARLNPITNLTGCPTQFSMNVKVFQAKLAVLDPASIRDSVQCFHQNYFQIKSNSIPAKFPMGVTYNWNTADGGSSLYPVLRKTYDTSGTFRIRLVLTAISYNKPTACKDTLWTTVRVLNNHLGKAGVNRSLQFKKNNRFVFSNPDPASFNQKWHFGDGDSATGDTVVHTYKDTGSYTVLITAENTNGCFGSDTLLVHIASDSAVNPNSINPVRHSQTRIFPNPASGRQINIESDLPLLQIKITDVLGKTIPVSYTSLSGNKYRITLTNSGMYMLTFVYSNGITETRRIRVEH